jgi:hypothetical protein
MPARRAGIRRVVRAGLRAFGERVLAGLSGDVLEIGGGTGTNLPCFGPAITSLTLTEPQPPMLRRLERAAASTARPPRSCARRPGTFRSTTTPSTWPCPRWCRAGSTTSRGHGGELRLVLRPGGQLLFIEHVCALAARLGAVR